MEASCVVCIQLGEGYVDQGDSWCRTEGVDSGGSWLWLGGAYILARLRHVAKVCFTCIGAVATNEFGSDAGPGGVGAAVDGRQPGRFDWVSRCGMQVRYESRNTGQVVGPSVYEEFVC